MVELLSGFDGAVRTGVRESRPEWQSVPENAEQGTDIEIADLLSTAPVAVDELIRQSGAGAPAIHMALLELEIGGRLLRHAGGRVSLA